MTYEEASAKLHARMIIKCNVVAYEHLIDSQCPYILPATISFHLMHFEMQFKG